MWRGAPSAILAGTMGRAYQNRKDSMAKTSDQKAKVYSRLSREIYVCAKAGDPDPASNAALKSCKKSSPPGCAIAPP